MDGDFVEWSPVGAQIPTHIGQGVRLEMGFAARQVALHCSSDRDGRLQTPIGFFDLRICAEADLRQRHFGPLTGLLGVESFT